jgi:hypothetical protein
MVFGLCRLFKNPLGFLNERPHVGFLFWLERDGSKPRHLHGNEALG